MLKIGSHISFKSPNYLIDSIQESINNGANIMMIYLGPPQSTKRVDISKYQLDIYKEKYAHIIKPEDIIIHAPYIINLANPEKSEFGKKFLIQEIERMNYIGSKYIVLHPGSSLKMEISKSIDHFCNNISEILDKTKNVEIIIETMAGKGTEIGVNLEQLSYMISKINHERVGICLDTCHMWDAGYDLKNDFKNNNGNNLISKLKELKIDKKIKIVHLNDSKNNIFSHKDRHENIGKGFIGLKALKNLVHNDFFDNIPIILETPWINNQPIYKEEISLLKKKD